MTAVPRTLSLAPLDERPAADADASSWQLNIAALQETQPDFAARLAAAYSTLKIDFVRLLDGSVEAVVPDKNGQATVPSSAPRSRAEGLYGAQQLPNAVFVGRCLSGHEVTDLLTRATDKTVFYIVATTVIDCVRILSVASFADPIRARRLFFLTADELSADLAACRARFSDLPPPQIILRPPELTDADVQELQSVIVRCFASDSAAAAPRDE